MNWYRHICNITVRLTKACLYEASTGRKELDQNECVKNNFKFFFKKEGAARGTHTQISTPMKGWKDRYLLRNSLRNAACEVEAVAAKARAQYGSISVI
jgi:hypothetical protein